jgi:hypothetical protein
MYWARPAVTGFGRKGGLAEVDQGGTDFALVEI